MANVKFLQRVAQNPWPYTDSDLQEAMEYFALPHSWLVFGADQYDVVLRLLHAALMRMIHIPDEFDDSVRNISLGVFKLPVSKVGHEIP